MEGLYNKEKQTSHESQKSSIESNNDEDTSSLGIKPQKYKQPRQQLAKKNGTYISKNNIKLVQMKTLEILIIGGPSSGKTTLTDQLLMQETRISKSLNSFDSGVGMSMRKAEVDLPSGETVKLCIWDPKTTILPKERVLATMQNNQEDCYMHKQRKAEKQRMKEERAKNRPGYLSQLMNGDLFAYHSETDAYSDADHSYQSSSSESSESSDEQAEEDTNSSLATQYLKSGTYHAAVFIFNIDNESSIDGMKAWYKRYRELCFKSKDISSVAIVGNLRSSQLSGGDAHVQQLINVEKQGLTQQQLLEEIPLDKRTKSELMQKLHEWFQQVKQSQFTDYTKTQPEIEFFEIDALSGRGTVPLKKWLINQSLRRYRRLEENRFLQQTNDKDKEQQGNSRICGFGQQQNGCLIF